ncbi:MAG: acyl-CoA dehydrogenase [Alphaproteobacteria bacterium]|nr:acyl-CoA dehydrogenase [Alphaproteobacteria bacterium]
MDFAFTDEQAAVRAAIERLCTPFDDAYWLARDTDGAFPEEFVRAVVAGGWLGIAMPEEVGGAGLGVTEAALMMHAISRSGAGFSGASSVHMNIFGLNPVVVFGTEEQRRRILPPIIRGEDRACFGVTEPDAGLNTTAISTRAERAGNGYVIRGKKVWTSTAQTANKILILVRTTPREQCAKPTQGMTLFYTDLDRRYVDVREIGKMGRKAVDSNEVFIDGLPVPMDDRIGEEGRGFEYLLHGLNPERVLIAAECIGLGQAALAKASAYARERVVFDRPIGRNQGIQHPLAEDWMRLEAAFLMTLKAASLYDRGKPCGAEANAAKFLGADAGFRACENAVLTHGGFGYAREFHVERYMRESMLGRIAPVSPHMILNFIGERVLGLPKSY